MEIEIEISLQVFVEEDQPKSCKNYPKIESSMHCNVHALTIERIMANVSIQGVSQRLVSVFSATHKRAV